MDEKFLWPTLLFDRRSQLMAHSPFPAYHVERITLYFFCVDNDHFELKPKVSKPRKFAS